MEKTILMAAAACLVLASCNKQEAPVVPAQTPAEQEVSVIAFNNVVTKGYTGWDASQTAFEEVTDPSAETLTPTVRKMSLSAYDATASKDFFVGETYAKDDTDGLWHATPKKYYPLGNDTFNFLAYSVGNEGNYIGEWEDANEVSLEVDEKFYQDDIIFAAGSASAVSPTVDLEFSHAQAWIHFNINITAESEKDLKLTVNSITWKDIFGKGLLKITADGDGANCTAKWNFFNQVASDIAMVDAAPGLFPFDLDPATKVAEVDTAGKVSKIDMLLPADQRHTNFVLNYDLGDQKGLEYECSLTSGMWEQGVRYTYNVKITINEVTAAPTVEVFDEVSEDFNI